MDHAYSVRRPPSRGASSTGYVDDDAALPRRGGVWPPSRRLKETKTMLASPGPLESMLKITTETGDIGVFSMGPSQSNSRMRTPYHPTMGPGRGLPSRTMSMDTAGRRHLRDDRRGLPSYRDTTSEIISMYGPNRDNSGPGSFSRSLDDAGPRSYSLTSCSSRLLSDQKSTGTFDSRSSGGDEGFLARPRSPYSYHTRLKRPGVRPISPALTSDGIIDYSRMVEIDRPSYRTVHRSHSRAYPPNPRPPHPRSRSGDDRTFQYLACGSGDNMARPGRAVPELPLAWVNQTRNQFDNGPPETSDETSTITSIVKMYGHSRASSVHRQPPISRMGSFYYDYSEDFEHTAQRSHVPCVPVSPMPTRSPSMNRPMVLEDGCEPLLVGGTVVDNTMLSALHEHPSSSPPSPSQSGGDSEAHVGTPRCDEAVADGVPETFVSPDPVSSDVSPGSVPVETASADSAPCVTVPQDRDDMTSMPQDNDDTTSSVPVGSTGRAVIGQAELVHALAKTKRHSGALPPTSEKLRVNTTVMPTSPEGNPQDMLTSSKTQKHELPFNDSAASIDSHRLLDVSFASTADNSGSDLRDTEPETTPAASEYTRGRCRVESDGCSEGECNAFTTPTARRRSDMYSLQSGLSDFKSFVQNLDNAGLLQDGDISTSFVDNDIRRSSLLERVKLDAKPDVHALLLKTNKVLADDYQAVSASSHEGDGASTHRHKRTTAVTRVSISGFETDVTFDDGHSVDGSCSINNPAKFIKALPPLPGDLYAHDMQASLKTIPVAGLRVPTRLSSFHVSTGSGQRFEINNALSTAKRSDMAANNTLSAHDTSVTYGTSGICGTLSGMHQWRRQDGKGTNFDPDGREAASASLSMQCEEMPSGSVESRRRGRNTMGMNGKFKSSTVRARPATRCTLAAMSTARRASFEANSSNSRFTEALASHKPLPPEPVHKRGVPPDGRCAKPQRGLKKSLSNLRMRLTESKPCTAEVSSPGIRLQRDGERIGVGVPVTSTGTSGNTSNSNSTMEETPLRGFRHRIARWVKSAKKAVNSCRRLSSSTGSTSLDTDF